MDTKAKDLIKQHFACTCGEMYKSRNLTDPNCFLCDNEEVIEDVMTIYANQKLAEFVDWYNETRGLHIPNSVIGQFNLSQK
jgi:hypothetical protein